jgi:hypothetical protein
MRHVHEQVGANLVGDLTEAREVELTGIGRPAGHNHLGPLFARDPRHLVHVDQARLAVDAVGDDLVQAS